MVYLDTAYLLKTKNLLLKILFTKTIHAFLCYEQCHEQCTVVVGPTISNAKCRRGSKYVLSKHTLTLGHI